MRSAATRLSVWLPLRCLSATMEMLPVRLTIRPIDLKIGFLVSDCTVDPSSEELKHHLDSLELTWPSDLTVEKNELVTNITRSMVAQRDEHWEDASRQLRICLDILITHRSSIPQELKLWLVKRICVPLTYISQFMSRSTDFHVREKDFLIASVAMSFMLEIVGEQVGERVWVQAGVMAFSVSLEFAKLRAQAGLSGLRSELNEESELYKFSDQWMSSETCPKPDLKARCCEYLCVQYYYLGQVGIAYNWLDEWKRSIECIAVHGTERQRQRRECKIVEAMLFAEHGADKTRALKWIGSLEKLYQKLSVEGNDKYRLLYILSVIRCIRLNLLPDEHQALQSTADKMSILLNFADEMSILSTPRWWRALGSARDEVALKVLEELIQQVQRTHLFLYPSDAALRTLSAYRIQQAKCHINLFRQKELKFYIDNMEKKRSSSDESSTSFSAASFKLCAHHCWSPDCQHDLHCTENDEDDEDEEENDEELAALGRHELESPSEFFTKRNIESDGNNLIHLDKAIQLLDKALENATKAGADVYFVVNVESFLADTLEMKAVVQASLVLGVNSWRPSEKITPEFLNSNSYHTLRQVHDHLERNGTSPDKAFRMAHSHYQQCEQMFTKHLDLLEYYSEAWVDAIEKQKELYVNLQRLMSLISVFNHALYSVLSELKDRPAKEVEWCEAEKLEIQGNCFTEALLWSERARARSLEQQLDQREQQPDVFPKSRSTNLSAFYSNDQVAWDVIRSSLDTCGEGTMFLEYFFGDGLGESAIGVGRVYGVLMESHRLREPLLMADILGDPMELQYLIEHLNKAMDPESQPGSQSEYDDEAVRRDLEKLYTLLIPPGVARFLKIKRHVDHKLVICPSQVFTKVPFAVLRNPDEPCVTKGYMFQSHTISITPSVRVLKHNMERYTALQEMMLMEGDGASVAMGDPCYKNEDRRLKKSGAEVEAIASLFPNRCKLLMHQDATVANLLKSPKVPSTRSQAFVHIAAHCETDDVDKKQGILCLAEQDCSDIASSSSTPPVSFDGILSAENVIKSNIDWRFIMVVLSACGSGKGEIKAEGVLNLARAFMVAGVPCSVVSQWKVEDDSTARLMTLFYQRMIQGLDVATALRSSMQEMLDDGFSIRQWAPFMVWGLPTVCLPDELLSEDAGVGLLRRGEELIRSFRYSDAILPLERSLKLLKAKESPPTDLVHCLSLLIDCEELEYRIAKLNERDCSLYVLPHSSKGFTIRRRDKYKADEFRHLTSAVGYLDEALKYAENNDLEKRSESLNSELTFWKTIWKLPRGSGIDVVVQYDLTSSYSSPHKILQFCVMSQVHLPRYLARKVDNLDRLKIASRTASMMSADSNPESGSLQRALEYLHEILIKPLLEDSLISATQHQTLVFIPCTLLKGIPFALLRDGAQPDGEGYLIQTHTISLVPVIWILSFGILQVLHHQTLLLMPNSFDASLVLCNPAISQEEMETGKSGPAFTVASLFPNHSRALHGADSTVGSFQIWASLPLSYTETYCQAFFHIEVEIGEGSAKEIGKCGPREWSACFAVVRACPSADWQKNVALYLVDRILRHGIPCVVMSNYPVSDVSADVFFTHLYTKLKSGESVGAAVRHSMLEMKNVEGFDLDQWASFSVFGDPTARLPEEMLGSPKNPRHGGDLPISPRSRKILLEILLSSLTRCQ